MKTKVKMIFLELELGVYRIAYSHPIFFLYLEPNSLANPNSKTKKMIFI